MSKFGKLFLVFAVLLGVFFVATADESQAGGFYGGFHDYGYGYNCYTPHVHTYYKVYRPYVTYYNYGYGHGCYGW